MHRSRHPCAIAGRSPRGAVGRLLGELADAEWRLDPPFAGDVLLLRWSARTTTHEGVDGVETAGPPHLLGRHRSAPGGGRSDREGDAEGCLGGRTRVAPDVGAAEDHQPRV